MNTKNLIVGLTLFIVTSLNAQEFKAGLVGGATFSQVHGDAYVGFHKIGVLGGLYVAREISEFWTGQLEIVYKQKGSRHKPNESKGDYNLYKLSFDYLEVPLVAKVRMTDISFEGGVAFGALIGSSEEDQYGAIPSIYPFEDYEISGILGVCYQFHERMYANLRWSYAMTRVRKAYGGKYDGQKPPHWMDGKFGQRNHLISFSIYYEFGNLFQR